MKYFYYNERGEKRGTFSGREIKAMARGGLIYPATVIETEEGKQYPAHGIEGVIFGNVSAKNESPSANAHDSSIVLSDRGKTISSKSPSTPKWLDEIDERKSPDAFVSSIVSCIRIAGSVFRLLLLGSAILVGSGLFFATNDELLVTIFGMLLLASGIFLALVTFLSWGLVDKYLKFVRATFCYQCVVEQQVKKQTEILQHSNNVYFVDD